MKEEGREGERGEAKVPYWHFFFSTSTPGRVSWSFHWCKIVLLGDGDTWV